MQSSRDAMMHLSALLAGANWSRVLANFRGSEKPVIQGDRDHRSGSQDLIQSSLLTTFQPQRSGNERLTSQVICPRCRTKSSN
ncbi:hypothetical protein AVEN_269978-1 [Araneus ventricosus]|uniref:Uncharacterized protein n=1 Tax=Araneus ventricosus TaxID=182803 RepID=A0A4Y2R6Z7_ARAVE|nr:hypothetical protein AVEN_269978-1 [Araneus ventricosus]